MSSTKNKNNSKASEYRLIGNEFYKASRFFKALELYNKSLCYAIPQTEDFALGFANRSAVYFEIEEYKACLENIHMACVYGYPRDKIMKLYERFDRCQEQIKCLKTKNKNDPKNFFKLSYPANKKIPYIIDGIELRESDEYGRFLITTRKLNAGDIIAIEEPFFKYITNAGRFTHCANCLRSKLLNLYPCSECNYTMFCSKECVSIGHRFHDFECDVSLFKVNKDGCILHMCHRVVFETLGIFGDIGKLKEFLENNRQPTTIFDIGDMTSMSETEKMEKLLLVTHSLQRNPLPVELILPMAFHSQFMTSVTEDPALKKFLDGFMIWQMRLIVTNSFEMSVDYEEFGAGVFPFASYFNHSCAPNVYRVDYDGKLIFFVIRPIEANEQLFVCYRENFHHNDRETRQNVLQKAYSFTCQCEACRKNYVKLRKLPKYDKKLKIASSDSLPLNSIIAEYKSNCDYINANYQKYPSYEICKLIERNYDLLNYITCFMFCFVNTIEKI